ncbi:NAD(P)/FAD-dependent oxidoreductase [Polynucleobacter sphagniphilus]|uniref:NAD(P)/FAD-dependent oxidoreductase n=1 Tax=Polynucleobacter sphagniphilus TaxID=1743169 RepID=UPI002404D78F|nr:FAD-dependent oxidoreductase [Polynucleobacter sphagniphilus]MDF9787288.1 rubredoxin-NAD+ reductase [Polynucleobacter sphagniphilus]MDH6300079.1 rubredoxin-NAD+ reductase [Polynucleobacter sphagniphilus]MDH6524037.1 rubredoxin-NAD+ reductase [Polynucleobacter sphagniphilus]
MNPTANPTPSAIVIIGSGLAGYTLIREIRKLDKEAPITLVTREPGYLYSKPMLSTALASKKEPENLISNSSENMATQLNINILSQTDVNAIDTNQQMIVTTKGNLSYGKLVLALGADQIRIPLQGDAATQVLTVNDLEDYAAFRKAISGKKKVSILGAGLIGCEFANDLVLGGYEVDVIDLAPQALGRLLPEAAAHELQDRLTKAGVRWHFGTTVGSISNGDDSLIVELTNGQKLLSDVVLSAVGLKPRLDLAKAAGISTNIGIAVNRELQTSATNVYSLGDCAEVDGLVLPYVMPIMQAARALANTLLGRVTTLTYPAMPVMVKTPAFPTIVSPPAQGSEGDWKIAPIDDGLEARFESADGSLLGFVLLGAATAQRASLTKELPPVLQ